MVCFFVFIVVFDEEYVVSRVFVWFLIINDVNVVLVVEEVGRIVFLG